VPTPSNPELPEPADEDTAPPRNQSSLLRKGAIGLAGGSLVAAGVVMLVTPGPGLITIAGGLAVLSKEFTSAEKLMGVMRRETVDRLRKGPTPSGDDSTA